MIGHLSYCSSLPGVYNHFRMSIERRKLERKYLIYFSRVVDRRNNWLVGYLQNLTTEGANVVGEVELPVGSYLHARIDIPEGLCNQKSLDLIAQVMWSHFDKEDGTFKAGVRFINTSERGVGLLKCMMDQFSIGQ